MFVSPAAAATGSLRRHLSQPGRMSKIERGKCGGTRVKWFKYNNYSAKQCLNLQAACRHRRRVRDIKIAKNCLSPSYMIVYNLTMDNSYTCVHSSWGWKKLGVRSSVMVRLRYHYRIIIYAYLLQINSKYFYWPTYFCQRYARRSHNWWFPDRSLGGQKTENFHECRPMGLIIEDQGFAGNTLGMRLYKIC